MTNPGVGLDLLVYHDMTAYTDTNLTVGADAGVELGEPFAGYHIVAVGPPIHEGKDRTVVLAFGARPMTEIQALLDKIRPS
jgi:hypothetical protein